MGKLAYTSIRDGNRYRLVVADADGGYSHMKESGDPTDPFYKAKGPIWFDTDEEGYNEAARRNERELHLTPEEALDIVTRSMFPAKARKRG